MFILHQEGAFFYCPFFTDLFIFFYCPFLLDLCSCKGRFLTTEGIKKVPYAFASFCSLTTSAKAVHRTVFFRRQVCSLLVRIPNKKEKQCQSITSLFGGELGIRTLGTLRTQHFECCTFDLSDNSPYIVFEIRQHVFQAYLFHNGYSIKKPCGCQ